MRPAYGDPVKPAGGGSVGPAGGRTAGQVGARPVGAAGGRRELWPAVAGGRREIRILAADDHSLLRGALCELLDLHDGLTVVAQAGDGPSAVALAAEHQPDIVLLDVEMPGPGPLQTVRALRERAPQARIVVLTMHDDARLIESLLKAGTSAYLHKEVDREILVSAIRSAMAGGKTTFLPRPVPPSGPHPLTDRERELMTLVAEGLSNRQIGTRLGIAEGTVKRHLRNVFDKLGAASRLDAVNRLREFEPF
ncbi:response regulator [Streptomyces griseosporeus]